MVANSGTYCKAFVLLFVFSLNTVVSFACSLSDVFHHFHHHNSGAKTETKVIDDDRSRSKMHHHNHDKAHPHDHDKMPEEEKDQNTNHTSDDCCSNAVVEMQLVDKSVSRSIDAPNVFFVGALLAAYYPRFFNSGWQQKHFPDFTRWRPPATIQDLRIVIQSFQI